RSGCALTMRELALLSVAIYVASQAFDSMLRWILDMAGAAWLIYVRDLGLLLAVFACFASIGRDRRDVARPFWLLAAFAVAACNALGSDLGLMQTLFGMKVWLPFVCGYLIAVSGFASGLNVR